MGNTPTPSEQRVVLDNVSWQQFENLLTELNDNRSARFCYDQGRLEMMTPTEEHERCRKLIESLLLVLVDETYLKLVTFHDTVLKRRDLKLGVEPDAFFYIQHAARMQTKRSIELAQDPLPELILEVAFTPSALNKLPLYAALGLPEVWFYKGDFSNQPQERALQIYQLQGDRYQVSSYSSVFPFLPAARVLEFVEQSDTLGLVNALQVLRAWVQQSI